MKSDPSVHRLYEIRFTSCYSITLWTRYHFPPYLPSASAGVSSTALTVTVKVLAMSLSLMMQAVRLPASSLAIKSFSVKFTLTTARDAKIGG